MESIIMVCIGCFLAGIMVGGLGLVVWANIAHAKDVKKARAIRAQQKTAWDINVPGVG